MEIIDLTMPVDAGHFRWRAERSVRGDFARGDLFEASTMLLPCHGFTHVDARAHMIAGAETIEKTPLCAVVGACAVVDLSDAGPEAAIDAGLIQARLGAYRPGDILLLRTGWDRQRSPSSREYWTQSPYVTRDAAEFLLTLDLKTIAYDFCQDFVVRQFLDGGPIPPIAQHVTHDLLLRNGVTMVEYLVNCASLTKPRIFFSAAPLKISGADGAPARAFAIESLAV
jgi:arylformamidase